MMKGQLNSLNKDQIQKLLLSAIGLVAHLQEEAADPIATELWTRVEEEASEQARGN